MVSFIRQAQLNGFDQQMLIRDAKLSPIKAKIRKEKGPG